MRRMQPSAMLCLFAWAFSSWSSSASELPVQMEITGDWQVKIRLSSEPTEATLDIPQATELVVVDEGYETLPVFQPHAPGYAKGVQLVGVRAQETTTPGLLDPTSVVVQSGKEGEGRLLVRGQDYEFDEAWGTLGRLETGSLAVDHPVRISYRYTPMRLDSVALTPEGTIVFHQGTPRSAAPLPAEIREGERLVGRIWQPGKLDRLTVNHVFPILETAYPEATKSSPTLAEAKLPRTMAKIRSGEPVRILAWGDSVTESVYLPERERTAWQFQFLTRLQARFPEARIELLTEGWGGRTTAAYLAEPVGSPRHYEEKVLALKPDLIVSEFVNDAGMSIDEVKKIYPRLLSDFQAQGTEWLILTPHYVRPDWMGLDRERDIDNDPRPYVSFLREFSNQNQVGLADAALRYGRLWRQGVPYVSLMLNSINHPDERGMTLFADALMEVFP